ncbi:MAG: undecaprenyldiphospho-muramoylpentapeptide beta-N-acetylglucosaminyltransferase [Candidatus Gastranaerophilales bacterium]|nr:undecaprenyldiphospho-muramoylpentapeptide beta-N-acetylglucosaminyltransferase [Candidatus Gastranaerophilales bacterium]
MNKDISEIIFFITGGGTGGHIYPAVSVIDELISGGAKKENIFYIGNKKNQEYKIALDRGYNFLSTSVSGMPRKFSFKFLNWLFCLFISILKSFYFIFKYKPDVIFATGGYVCAPVLFAGRFLKIPYVLHDGDCFPGITTRAFAKSAKAVNLAFSDADKYIKSAKIYHYNNPVRSSFFYKTRENARMELGIKDEFLILIMGGSQGAKSLNEASIEFINQYRDKTGIKIILQTGKKNYEEVANKLKIPDNTRIEPYFDDMSIPILAADLIVSRAGSISISEILSARVPSILVPYPYAASDHQRINARKIENQGAAIYLEDSDLSSLKEKIEKARANYDILKENAAKLSGEFKNSNEKIAALVLNAAKNEGRQIFLCNMKKY